MAVILARADCLRHQLQQQQAVNLGSSSAEAAAKLRAWFQRGSELMASHFPQVVDRSLRLPSYWAHVEGVVLGDVAAMRGVWEEATKGQLGK
jgi:hypothetical protein